MPVLPVVNGTDSDDNLQLFYYRDEFAHKLL